MKRSTIACFCATLAVGSFSTPAAAQGAVGDYIADPAGAECDYVPHGALDGRDLVDVVFYIGTSGTVPPGLVRVRGTSDTGLFTEFSSGAGGAGFTVAQFPLRPNDFGRTHAITIDVDPDNRVAETNETNNRVRAWVTLPSPRPTAVISPLPCTVTR